MACSEHGAVRPIARVASSLRGLLMGYWLRIQAMLRRAETLYGQKEIVTRLPDKLLHRYHCSEMIR